MAEDLVTTATSVKERRILTVFYIAILTVTAIIIAVIVWVVDRQEGLISTDVETYEQILDSISASNSKLNIIDDNIVTLNAKLESSETDISSTKQILADLSALYTQAILINYEITSEYESVLLLDLSKEYHEDAEDQIIRIRSGTERYQITLDKIDRELFTLDFNMSYLTALECYDTIDVTETAALIASEVVKCHRDLDDSLALLEPYKDVLNETINYISLIRTYWDTNVLLYQAIERQDEVEANSLRADLEQISIQRSEKESDSSEELAQFTDQGL